MPLFSSLCLYYVLIKPTTLKVLIWQKLGDFMSQGLLRLKFECNTEIASLDMPVFVSQVLISFVTQHWGIPKLKIVPASDYAPHLLHTFPSPWPVQLYTYQKLQQCYHIDWGEFRQSQTAACATSA